MKKIFYYLRYKQVYLPVTMLLFGLVSAYCAKRFLTGSISTILTIFGFMTSMSGTEMLANAIGHIRSEEMEEAEKEYASRKKK